MEEARKSSCPVDLGNSNVSQSSVNKFSSNECPIRSDINDYDYGNEKFENQSTNLSVKRSISSIPKGDYTPYHQPAEASKWIYPSEQQYYNAMKRKGYNPSETDVPVILAIHNLVNEQGWSMIKRWEAYRGCDDPKLIRFCGRPKDVSPKAYLKSLLGYSLPFDRHDWIISRRGKEVRYVIDFYEGSSRKIQDGKSIPVHLDVRPALDSYTAIIDRFSIALRGNFFPSTKFA